MPEKNEALGFPYWVWILFVFAVSLLGIAAYGGLRKDTESLVTAVGGAFMLAGTIAFLGVSLIEMLGGRCKPQRSVGRARKAFEVGAGVAAVLGGVAFVSTASDKAWEGESTTNGARVYGEPITGIRDEFFGVYIGNGVGLLLNGFHHSFPATVGSSVTVPVPVVAAVFPERVTTSVSSLDW